MSLIQYLTEDPAIRVPVSTENPLPVSLGEDVTLDFDTTELNRRIGDTDDTAAASDTADASLNALLKRIAQHLTTVETNSGSTDTVNVAQDTAAVKNGSTSLTPKFAKISSTDDGDTVALVSTKKLRVLSMYFVVAGATTVKFQSGATTDLTGAMSFAANGGISLPFNPVGWFETAAGEKLNHVLGSNVAIAGGLTYIEV